MRQKYQAIVRRAKSKSLPLDLTFDDFRCLKLSDCEYCGVSEILLRYYCEVMGINTPWMTIDRKDNNKGYTKDNCVPACYLCNKIKGAFFNYDEMKKIGWDFVRPKILCFEKEACESFKDWCDSNIFFEDD